MKPSGSIKVDPKPQTGAKPNQGAGILRDVGLV
jgi:hypothetical protein